jgi:hypothetical protein
MPAINVARTDTFEQQRVKINQIGSTLFTLTSGGSDLAAGNLKLGDGTRLDPSLSFDSDNSLGLYKSDTGTLGFVSAQKKILDLNFLNIVSFKDLVFQQKVITTQGTSLLSSGSGYDPGSYVDIPLIGGTGENATVDLVISAYDVSTLSNGSGYNSGTYFNVELSGGTGSGATINFDVDQISGLITNAGSGYVPSFYTNVPLTGGSGTGAIADILVSGNVTINGTISNPGSGYAQGSYTVEALNTPTQTFVVTVTGSGTFQYNIDGVTQPTLNLLKGNTYRFDVSDASNIGHTLSFRNISQSSLSSNYYILSKGSSGSTGAFVDLVIDPDATESTIEYYCTIHSGMGAGINLSSGSIGSYGRSAFILIESDISGSIISASFVSTGIRYKSSDVIRVYSADSGGGSGFSYTITSILYEGEVVTVTIVNSGINYEFGDILSASDASLGSGGGSGFSYSVNTNPSVVSSYTFVDKGTGYSIGDILVTPSPVNNVSTVLPGFVSGVSATLGASTSVTVSSTSGIVPGMSVSNSVGDIGVLQSNTTVISIDSPTTITISLSPVSPGSASLNFASLNGTQITVSDTAGIYAGYSVTKVSGNGILFPNTTVSSVQDSTTIILSNTPSLAGSAVLNFSPSYGNPSSSLSIQVDSIGVVESFDISNGGNGYFNGDELTVSSENLTQPIDLAVEVISVDSVSLSGSVPASNFSVGDFIKVVDGEVFSVSVSSSTQIPSEVAAQYTNVTTTTNSVNGSGLILDISRDNDGNISTINVSDPGRFYEIGDIITVSGNLVGGSSPTDNLTISVNSTSISTPSEIFEIVTSGSNIDFLIIEDVGLNDLDEIIKTTDYTTVYTIDGQPQPERKYIIDGQYLPNLTLYSGNTYRFDLTDQTNTGLSLSFSRFKDGIYSPSVFDNISTTLDNSSDQIVVPNTSGILEGMEVLVLSGSGTIPQGTVVSSVINSTTLRLSNLPINSGDSVIQIRGLEYTDGVTKNSTETILKVTDLTPSPLYIYTPGQENIYGSDNNESFITIDQNNPKTFGSGLLLRVSEVTSENVITNDIETGEITSKKLIVDEIESDFITNSNLISSNDVRTTNFSVSSISSLTQNISLSASQFNVSSRLNVGTFSVNNSNGNVLTNGEIKTTNRLNVNDILFVTNNTISTSAGSNLILQPSSTNTVNVSSSTAFGIPFGTTAQRPLSPISGHVRFNTQTNQFEGYSAINSSWSSLGGVRDLDGNTTILAELTVGANDNTLWFINDSVNTLKITPSYLEFVNVKKIRSLNTSAPNYFEWTANTSVSIGQYLKYGNNIFEVVSSGVTGTSGNQPTDTSGLPFTNGTATLQYFVSAVSSLTFEEISEVKIAPQGGTSLTVNGDLRFSNNSISTDINDLVIRPNSGKKVIIDAPSTLVIPSGFDVDRGIPDQGSIRFSKTSNQFEGYDGANWGSLGGVKDVDQNTYIIPELSPGSNENILYFYNDNNNTLQLTTTSLDFYSVDTIRSVTSDELEITASLLTFDGGASTFDNTATDRTFLHTTKQYFDLGLSAGLTTDPVLRLDDQGDVYLNIGFGTGVYNGVKVFDGDLKEFELADVKILTEKLTLVKGTSDNGSSVIYAVASNAGAKTTIVAENPTSGDKEFIEFGILDDGTDVFHTEYGNIRTGTQLIVPTFEVTGAGDVRINIALGSAVNPTEAVNITVVSNITKK